MPLLKAADQALLREEFKNLTNPVRLIYFTQALGCDTCEITEQILDEIVPLSDKLELVTKNFAIDKDAVEQYAFECLGPDRASAQDVAKSRETIATLIDALMKGPK